jgi:ankyrin repeat protein
MELQIVAAGVGIFAAIVAGSISGGAHWLSATLKALLIVAGLVAALAGLGGISLWIENWRERRSLPPMVWAARQRNAVQRFGKLLAKGADVNAVDEYGACALHAAVSQFGQSGQVDEAAIQAAVDWLLVHGASVDARTRAGDTALALAVSSGRGLALIDRLLQAGADANAALHAAAWPTRADAVDVMRRLLDAGANIDTVNANGATALHGAARLGTPEMVALLLARGASARARDHAGETPLHGVLRSFVPEHEKDVRIVRALLAAGADVNAADGKGETPLHIAAGGDKPLLAAALGVTVRPPG